MIKLRLKVENPGLSGCKTYMQNPSAGLFPILNVATCILTGISFNTLTAIKEATPGLVWGGIFFRRQNLQPPFWDEINIPAKMLK